MICESSLGEHRLAAAGRPEEDCAARRARAELLVLVRLLEVVDELLHLDLGLVEPGHVGKLHVLCQIKDSKYHVKKWYYVPRLLVPDVPPT